MSQDIRISVSILKHPTTLHRKLRHLAKILLKTKEEGEEENPALHNTNISQNRTNFLVLHDQWIR